METLILAIEGMSCAHCVGRVNQALATTPGVHVNEVAIGSASLTYDAAVITPDAIAGAVIAAGYPARATRSQAAK